MAFATRTELGGTSSPQPGTTLLRLVHISDLHVLDAASPARAEWVELEGDDPLWRPLLHMHRPYDSLAHHALAAHVQTINERSVDLVVSTGDNIDNAQRNELDAYLALMSGGVAQLVARGCAQDASLDPARRPWPFWSPDSSVDDEWRRLGYPVVEDFIERVSAPIRSAGLSAAWTSVPGNHDLMRQGTALETPALTAIATAPAKSLRQPGGFLPTDPLSCYLNEPEAFSTGATYAIDADPARRAIDRAEWIAAHAAAGAAGYGSGTGAAVGTGTAVDTVIDTAHVRLVLLDTNHPAGDYQGSIGAAQLAWLDERLAEVDADPGRIAILVSHHGADTLVNDLGHAPDRLLAGAMLDVVHRHRCVVAWLVGHRHINRIEPRPGPAGGLWEITTCSTIDWPSQTRAIDVVKQRDGSIELHCSMIDHGGEAGGLARLHRDLARRFASTGVATRMAGHEGDGDALLVLPPR